MARRASAFLTRIAAYDNVGRCLIEVILSDEHAARKLHGCVRNHAERLQRVVVKTTLIGITATALKRKRLHVRRHVVVDTVVVDVVGRAGKARVEADAFEIERGHAQLTALGFAGRAAVCGAQRLISNGRIGGVEERLRSVLDRQVGILLLLIEGGVGLLCKQPRVGHGAAQSRYGECGVKRHEQVDRVVGALGSLISQSVLIAAGQGATGQLVELQHSHIVRAWRKRVERLTRDGAWFECVEKKK